MKIHHRLRISAGVSALATLVLATLAFAQGAIHKNGFENKPGWSKGVSDGAFEEITHKIDDAEPHNGQGSEYIELEVKQGKTVHYVYPTGKAPISEEMRAGVWLRANRPGMQLMARIVLPKERDQGNLEFSLTTYLNGDVYQQTGKWQLLEISRAVTLAKVQQQVMTKALGRNFDFTGAYVDALVLNLNAGPGPTKVWIDDLEIGPVVSLAPSTTPERVDNNNPPKIGFAPKPTPRASIVQFNGTRLMVGNQRVLFRGIRYTDTMLPVLRNAGFNAVFFDRSVNPALVNEAGDLGMWAVPELAITDDKGQPLSADEVTKQVHRFGDNDAILFRRIGGGLAYEHTKLVSRQAQVARQVDPGHPIAVEVYDGLMPYSDSMKLVVGVHRYPLMTTMELPQYRQWLEQRRKLAAPDAFTWTWIQTHLPDWYSEVLYNQSARAEFSVPVGPQPEHIRLLTYTALASGCRGLAYSSDRFLADSHQGRDRLLCCALLNQELEMMKEFLVTARDAPQWVDTSVRDVKAAVFRCDQGMLVIPIWQGKFAQFVPEQAAVARLTLVVPQVPKTMQAWEVSPGEVRGLKLERVDQGFKVTLPEFGLTSMVVFTSDTNWMGKFQDHARARRQLAAQWSHDMALCEYEKVIRVDLELDKMGVGLPEGRQLLENAGQRLQKSKELWENKNFAEAYHEAERALRPVRILMRKHWEHAVRGMDTPVASPYAVSFYTLPKHWQLMAQKTNATVGGNVLPGGDFELPRGQLQENWRLEKVTLDECQLIAERVAEMKIPRVAKLDAKTKNAPPPAQDQPLQGQQCLMLQVKPRLDRPNPEALERTTIAVSSPAVKLPPGTLVQISMLVNVPTPITASPDGALFFDSCGGEPLAVRWTEPTPWKRFTVFRRVPASGLVNVTLALTGIGTVYFDDVRIEPLVPPNTVEPVAGR